MAPRMAKCPVCSEWCDVDRQMFLLDAETKWFRRQVGGLVNGLALLPGDALPEQMRQLAIQGHANWFWACDRCIDQGKAIAADVDVQNLSMGTPFAAYVDRPFQCADCGQPSTFSADEQRYWYETRQFLIWSHARQCTACRRIRRRTRVVRRVLEKRLASTDASTPDGLERIAELYRQLGNLPKSNEYAARARNQRKRR